MERYSERYWDNSISPLEEVVGAAFTLGLTTLMDNPGLAYQCEITDHETGVVGTTHEWWSSKAKAHDAASEDLREKQSEYYEDQRELERARLREYAPASRREADGTDLIALLVKWVVYVLLFFGAVWLALAVALPLVIINISVISIIIGLSIGKNKKYLFLLSLLGAIFILMDYNKGWFTKSLVSNVSFFEKAIPFFLYLNIAAGLIASYFLIRDFANERNQTSGEEGEFSRRNLIIMGSLLAVGATTIALQKYFDSKRNTAFYGYANTQTQTVPNNGGTNSNNTSSSQTDTAIGKADTSIAMVRQSAPNNSNPVSGGKFTGRFFDVEVPQGFRVRPSLTGSQDNGYSQYISAFFQSPDSQVEFYIFSGYFNDVASDVAIDPGKEKQTSILVKNTGQNEVTTWTEIKALDNSYYKAYQESKNRVTNEHKVVGLRYNTQAAYNIYKSQYLAFKKSYSELGGD